MGRATWYACLDEDSRAIRCSRQAAMLSRTSAAPAAYMPMPKFATPWEAFAARMSSAMSLPPKITESTTVMALTAESVFKELRDNVASTMPTPMPTIAHGKTATECESDAS